MVLWIHTIKYFRLAISEFTPLLKELIKKEKNKNSKEELEDLLEAYNEIAGQIDQHNLNIDDPNCFYDGEPEEINLNLNDEMAENLSRLSVRLLDTWKEKRDRLKRKKYKTDKNNKDLRKLEKLIRPLESTLNDESMIIGKSKTKGALIFPGESKNRESEDEINEGLEKTIFPSELINKLPNDLKILCQEFNFNYNHKKPNAGILLLRRILPLSIVRKFQKINRASEIIINGEYLETKALLGKAEGLLSNKRVYKEIINYKQLVDSSQHSYTLKIQITDTEGAAIKLRIFLDELF